MDNLNSYNNDLNRRHLAERRFALTSEIEAWQDLRVRHKQAIQKAGLANFSDWTDQQEEVRRLGLRFTLARAAMRNRQHEELKK